MKALVSALLSTIFLLLVCGEVKAVDEPAGPTAKISYVVKGKDFIKYEKALTKTRGPANQVEVIYFYWYGSDLSWKIERDLKRWAMTRSYPVKLVASPAILGDSPYQVLGARIHFTLVQMRRDDDLGPLFFEAVQKKHVDMTDPSGIVEWFEAHGVARKTFLATINSNQVKSSTLGVYRVMKDYQITAVPTIVIDGQYQVRVSNKTSPSRVLEVTEFMVEKLSAGGKRP